MGSEMKVKVIHKETIRPSSPTPSHLTISNLSIFDQLTPDVYAEIVLFYPSTNGDDHPSSLAKKTEVLKTSLSEALTRFYIFAGEFKYNSSINCNDQGALFVEARVNCPISRILDRPDLGLQTKLLPNGMEYRTQSGTRYVLLVQANFFECGGLAIGVSISHKVVDGSTLGKFLRSWAAIALGSKAVTVDIGATASRFPPLDSLNSPVNQAPINFVLGNVVKRRLVFDAPKIANLKFKAASTAVPNPTRAEVVSALVWKCAMEASRSNKDSVRSSAWNQAINLRRILLPPLGDDVLGNLTSFFIAKTEEGEVVDLQSLVAKLRDGYEKFKLRHANGFPAEEVFQLFRDYGEHVGKDDRDNYCSSSTCNFSFYSVNFGWGRATWVDFPTSGEMENMIVLVDASDGMGIEAHVTLKEGDMALFQTNQELLAYARHRVAKPGFNVTRAHSRI